MKACSKNRKPLAWLALDALDVRQAQDLRVHLETCEGCRRYLEEISNVAQRLGAAETGPDIQPSESFHQRVVRAVRAEETGSIWETLVAHLRGTLLNWRVALPVIGAAVLVIAALSVLLRHPGVPSDTHSSAQARLAPDLKWDPPPTIAHYTMVANQSLEKLDELLTRQGNRNPPPTRVYTASTLLRAIASD